MQKVAHTASKYPRRKPIMFNLPPKPLRPPPKPPISTSDTTMEKTSKYGFVDGTTQYETRKGRLKKSIFGLKAHINQSGSELKNQKTNPQNTDNIDTLEENENENELAISENGSEHKDGIQKQFVSKTIDQISTPELAVSDGIGRICLNWKGLDQLPEVVSCCCCCFLSHMHTTSAIGNFILFLFLLFGEKVDKLIV